MESRNNEQRTPESEVRRALNKKGGQRISGPIRDITGQSSRKDTSRGFTVWSSPISHNERGNRDSQLGSKDGTCWLRSENGRHPERCEENDGKGETDEPFRGQ
ncbi:uncharacterized protein LOC121413229 [Lytechinus variegatus]|uniref:uncharacterized protein LOC121413229 n=1 Tax=Lytechinus variegatus TaxID=7654 RepID=UPI001BB100AF|nr:uncharacterized protein LOC121413229 [Lytechinus variegatus]